MGGFGLVLHSVEFIHCGFYWRLLPVFLQPQRQTQSNGRHLKHTRESSVQLLLHSTPSGKMQNPEALLETSCVSRCSQTVTSMNLQTGKPDTPQVQYTSRNSYYGSARNWWKRTKVPRILNGTGSRTRANLVEGERVFRCGSSFPHLAVWPLCSPLISDMRSVNT